MNELTNDILQVLKELKILGVSLLVILLVPWVVGAFNSYMPSPKRAFLGARNFVKKIWHYMRPQPPLSEERFHVVLTWLAGDGNGESTKPIEGAFRDIAGIHLSRSAHIVKASGARDDWEPAMHERAREILTDRQADLAIIGEVKEPKKVLSLWFVPRDGDGTLSRGDRGSNYVLKNVTLGDDFHKEFRAQIAAMALSAVAPLVSNEARGKMLDDGLSTVAKQIDTLLKKDSSPIVDPAERERRAGLHMALGTALTILGERESGTDLLERAVAAYNAALEGYTRECVPLDWAMTQNNLGNALATLGERESGTERLEQAVAAYKAVLKEFTREHVPLNWAMTQNNLGTALAVLGERESSIDRLKQAVAAYNAALEEYTRELVPLDWAMTQHNLGNAFLILAECESGTGLLERAVAAYKAALEEYTRERVPRDWARTQHNLGNALLTLGKGESDTDRLKQAVAAYSAALEELTREHVPSDWVMTQDNLGTALLTLGKREGDTDRLELAVAAYNAVLEEYTRARDPIDWATTQSNLGTALQALGDRESGTEHLEQAVAAYNAALEVFSLDQTSEYWYVVQHNLHRAREALNKRRAES